MKQLLLILSLIITISISYGQLGYVAAKGVNTAGTYTDLGTDGTIIPTPGFDDDNSEVQNIGFKFFFNGPAFTQFVLNTNGAIKLGATPPDPGLYDFLNWFGAWEPNVIYALNLDLDGGTDPEYRVFTGGSAPNRVCTIQFKNVRDYFQYPAITPQFSDMDFQIKLYETTNNIEFVYGTFVAGESVSTVTRSQVGIMGSNPLNSVNVTKPSTTAWTTAAFIDGAYTANEHNIRNTLLPVPGTTYRFVHDPLPGNDAQVSAVYTLGKIPLGYGSPHSVKAIFKNTGVNDITNLEVTLNVTGANTFTNPQIVESLEAGASATVVFTGYSPTNIGSNTVSVSVAADDNNANNSISVTQDANASTFSYADNSPSTGSVGGFYWGGLLLNKYTLSGAAFVTGVNVFISGSTDNIGNTIYAVVLDSAGNIIGQSANYVMVEGDLGAYKSLHIVTAPFISGTDFFVGLAQAALTYNAVLGTQIEVPARSGAYYYIETLPPGGRVPSETTTAGRLMIEAVVSAAPVPITLSSFSGKIQGNTAFLNWLTTSEGNNDRFEVEKSLSGSGSWLKIGAVTAVVNAATTHKYQFTDAGLSNGKWMYRLKIFDKDGKFTFSPIVILQLRGKSLFVLEQNYPNPAHDVTMIRYELDKDATVTIELYSMDGKKIMVQQKGKQLKGSYNFPIDIESLGLANGKYVYRLVVQDDATGDIGAFKKEMQVIR